MFFALKGVHGAMGWVAGSLACQASENSSLRLGRISVASTQRYLKISILRQPDARREWSTLIFPQATFVIACTEGMWYCSPVEVVLFPERPGTAEGTERFA